MRKTLYQEDDSLYMTPPYNGLYILREAIAQYLEDERGMSVDPSQIIIGAGTEYLYGRLTYLFGRHSIFGFEDPGYRNLAAITESFGNMCRFIPSDENGLRVDLLDDSGVDIVHVSPANQFPTGRTMPVRRRAELIEWVNLVKKRYIIEDDYDSEFRYRGRYIVPMFADGACERVIYMNTFSKTMLPSLRISYMVLPKDLVERYRETVSFYSCTVSSFEQYTLAHFISEGYFARHINRLKNYYRKIRLSLIKAVQESKLGAISEIIEHNAGTHFLLDVRTKLSSEEIRSAAKKADINLRMYSDYCISVPKELDRAIVVNYAGVLEERIPEMVERLEMMFPECRA
jgi:GntR family transcriptional regulator/MocR family aminotransferase